MTILCLDAGNTRLKWGLRDAASWCAQGTLAHEDCAQIRALLPAQPERILACNVAGPAVAQRIEVLAKELGVPLEWFRSTTYCCGVTNGYDNPAQLGADRWAALIGARTLHQGPALVVMAGTATTIDVLDDQGFFRGGLILPGLDLMRRSLARHTAGLPEVCGSFREFPTNTGDAITSGCLQATLGAIERMAHLARQSAHADVSSRFAHFDASQRSCRAGFCIILSGGAAAALAPYIDQPLCRIEHLVLEGLAHAAARCDSQPG